MDAVIRHLIADATPHVHQVFGEGCWLQVTGQTRPEGGCLYRVVIQVPAYRAGDPATAFRRFDAQWWLANAHRAKGQLVFDVYQQEG